MNGSYADAVKRFEGFTPRASWDYKQHSNGYGTRAAYPGEQIDLATAEQRFSNEFAKAKAHVDSFAPNAPEGVKGALTSLTYNAGPGWSNAGLGRAVQAGDWDGARQHFLQYNKAGGVVNQGLVSRREQEAQWFNDNGQGQGALSGATGMPTQREVVPQQRYMNGYQPAPGAAAGATGALSPNSMMGPGALTDDNSAQTIGTGMQQAAAWLGSISNPATLGALPSLGPKPGRYQTQYDAKTGRILTIDTQTGRAVANQDPNFDKNREANEKYDATNAEAFAKKNQEINQTGMDADVMHGNLGRMRELVNDDKLYQGGGGNMNLTAKNWLNSMGMKLEGVQEGQEFNSMANGITLAQRKLLGGMPGSLSDSDRKFLEETSPSLNNSKEANLAIIDRLTKINQRARDYNTWRQEYVQQRGRLDEGFYRYAKAKADENPLFEAKAAAPAAAAAPANRRPLGDIFK
jgi:GH24 family phage-related lysozyme (muramidase)